MKFTAYIILVILFNTLAYSQDERDLKQCIDYALAHNPDVLQQKEKISIDSINLKINQFDRLPKINLSAHQGFQLGNTYNVSTGIGQKQSSYTNFNLSAQLDVFQGFLKKYLIKQQKEILKKTKYQYENTRWQLEYDVINAYFQILYENENLVNLDFLIENQKKQVDILQKLNKKQYKSTEDVISAQIDLKNLLLQRQETKKQIKQYTLKLAGLMFIEPGKIHLKKQADIIPAIIDTTSVNIEKLPRLLSYQQEINLLDIHKKIEKSKRFPQITFNYSFGSNYYHIIGNEDVIYNQQTHILESNDFLTQMKNNRLHYLGIGMNIPVFNGFKIKNKLKIIAQKKQIASYNYQSEKQKTLNLYRQLSNEINNAAQQYKMQKEILKLTEKNYQIKKKKFLKNMIPYYDWQQINNRYFKAKTKLLQTKYDYLLKLKLLNHFAVN